MFVDHVLLDDCQVHFLHVHLFVKFGGKLGPLQELGIDFRRHDARLVWRRIAS